MGQQKGRSSPSCTDAIGHEDQRGLEHPDSTHAMPQVMGILGSNGTGKSTACKILAGKMKPNLKRYEDPPQWQEIVKSRSALALTVTFSVRRYRKLVNFGC